MPLIPPINNDDIVVHCEMQDVAAAGQLCQFPALSPGKVKALWIQLRDAPNAQINFILTSKHGTFAQTPFIANAAPSTTAYFFELSLNDRANYFDAGEPLTVLTDGGGSAGGIAHMTAIFTRG